MSWQVIGKIAGRDGRDGADGRSADEEAVAAAVLANLPRPKDGTNGKDADPALIQAAVEKAVAAFPRPRDGESVHPDTVRILIAEEVRKAFTEVRLPKDGANGLPGKDALDIDILPAINETRSYPRGTWARHRKGLWRAASNTEGMRGWECVVAGVVDIHVEQTQERKFTVTTSVSDGDPVVHEFSVPVMIYREIFRHGTEYMNGDNVTYAGSIWIALVDRPTKVPGDPTDGKDGTPQQWRLAVKKGAPGKDAK